MRQRKSCLHHGWRMEPARGNPPPRPQGVKLGDFQATVMGMLSAALFFVISHAKPLEALSPQRPHPNIFSPYVFLSLIGQFVAHMGFLIYMYSCALAAMPPVTPAPHASPLL